VSTKIKRCSLLAASIIMIMAVAMVSSGSVLAEYDVKSIIINPNPPYQTSIWTDRSQYDPGDRLNVYFRTSKDAYVYIFDIDTVGNVSLIFPNIYSGSNYKRAGQTHSLPDNARYNLTIGGPAGVEQLVMIATPSQIRDVDWLRRSLEQGSFGPQLNVNITADRFMFEVKSVTITPVFGQDWSSAVTSFTVGRVSTPLPPPPPPVSRGTLNITSKPSGATVFLDGVEKGTTPLTITGVAYGVHDIAIMKKHYYTYSRQITVNSPNPYHIDATLARLPASSDWDDEVQLVNKSILVKWPQTGPFTETFTFRGSTGSVVINGDPILGMLSRVTGNITADAVGPVEFMQIKPSGPDSPWPGRVYEKIQYPFRVRVAVEDYSITTGAVFGIEYIDHVRLRLEIWHIGR
jgi:hypothetical protein